MIIQCEQCQAKFKLDDSKVTDKGVKVRCAKCKHVFTVSKAEQPPAPSDQSPLPGKVAVVPKEVPSEPVASPERLQKPETSPFSDNFVPPPQKPQEPESSPFSFDDDTPEKPADNTVRMEPSQFAPSSLDSTFATAGNDEFSLSSLEEDSGFAVDHSSTHDEVDFGSFDFGGGTDSDKTMVAPPTTSDFGDKTMIQPSLVPPPTPVKKEIPQGLDFSDDDMFGAVVTPPQPVEDQVDSISFDFGDDSFADSMDTGSKESAQKNSSLSLDSSADAPFSLGEIDFGDELTSVAVHQVNPDELKPSQETLFAPLAEAIEKPVTHDPSDDDLKKAFLLDSGATSQEDLPPLSITSRRKQSPLFTVLIAVFALVLLAGGGYYGYTTYSETRGSTAKESGKITVRKVKSSFLKNASAGTLLVITGEAVNEYPAPRAAIQLKGMIYDAKGQVLTSKNAFCGNLLTDEQLAALPLDKIEAAMANHFGDSLANLEVAPGKAVPFMIVISNIPKDGKDMGVTPAGSTAAEGKQK